MESLGELLKSRMTILESTGKTCTKHGKKVVQFIMVQGEEVCPLCERDAQDELLAKQELERYERAMSRRDYRTLATKSILKDTKLFDAKFGNYETSDPEETANKRKAVNVFQKYRKGEVFNTWFTGMPGVGKSHLAMSILQNLNEWGEQDKSCLFVSVDEMLLLIRNSFDNKESQYSEYYFVDLLSKVDYLVLDDLGAETGGTGTQKTASDFTLRILYAISNARQGKSTIVTTNLSKRELTKMYDAKLVSRLQGSIALINFKETSDKRIKQIEV